MKRLLLIMVFVCFAIVSVSDGICDTKIIKWRAQSAFPRGDFSADLLIEFAKEVKSKSNGRLLISTYFGGDLVPMDDTMKATSQGMIQMSQAIGDFWSSVEPILALEAGIPFGYMGSLEEVEKLVIETGLYKLWEKAYERQNCHLLGIHTYGPYPAIVSNNPIRKVEDFKGLKIRSILVWADFLKELGAAPGYIPGGEVYMALKLGAFDAATYSVDAIRGMKWHEVMNYFILPYMCDWYFGDVIINKQAWDKLPEDLRQILNDAMSNYAKANKEVYENEKKVIVEEAEKLGYEVITLPKEEVNKMRQIAIEKIWPAFAGRSPEIAKAVEAIKTYQGIK